MPEIKISEMDELLPYDNYTLEGGTDTADYLPILDVSELDPNLQNKKVTIQTLFDDYTRQYNFSPYEVERGFIGVTKETLTNNFFDLNFSNYFCILNPGFTNRTITPNIVNAGDTKLIKNNNSVNNIMLVNLLTNTGTNTYTYTILPNKTIQLVFDGEDHHVIAFD